MTRKEKELLIKDLCARLPYGVIVHFEGWNPEKLTQINLQELIFNDMGGIPMPYLRPLSSMTEEEKYQYEKTQWEYQAEYCAPEYFDGLESYDWLNAHHFDYRGLIEKGLALEEPEGMYNN